jgi:hypothetical protein
MKVSQKALDMGRLLDSNLCSSISTSLAQTIMDQNHKEIVIAKLILQLLGLSFPERSTAKNTMAKTGER